MTSRNDTKAHASRSLDGVASFAPAVSSAPSAASRLFVPLLWAEAAAFGALALSGKIPESLITAIRALLTF
jgi:hypothetical protein